MKWIAIDFETANANRASACSVGVVVYDDKKEIECWSMLIKSKRKYGYFDWRNSKIHHITSQDVKEANGFDVFYYRLMKYFDEAVFVAHNADFDMNVFKECCLSWNLEVPKLYYFCTVKLAKNCFPFLKHHRLNDCCQMMNVELNHHDALSDAKGCAMIVKYCMEEQNENELEKWIKRNHIPVQILK